MKKTLITLAGAALVGAATMALAGGHSPVEKREAAMKTVGGVAKTIGDMLKGSTDFDATKANAALGDLQAAVADFGTYFPDGTELQGSNQFKASPKIWSDRAGFDAELAKFQAAIETAVNANAQDKAGLGAVFGVVGQSCGSCHESYRVKQ